ncbi:MAG TPA: TIR domain-containing protein [Pyrinomonadaceae bacterium]|nr:TIR domain-containing protein [Pyrinomonadaceae bacterium]
MNGKERILVLDDNKDWLTTIKNLLGDNYDLILTTSVAQARRHVKESRIALAILDQRLSKNQRGIRVLGDLRKDLPDLRAIILTEFANYPDARNSFNSGALDYISKRERHLKSELIKSIERNKETKAIRVFLSYQSDDRNQVEKLYRGLTERGFIPWMDKYSARQGKWEPQTYKAIDESDYFIACFSSGSLRKKQSIFRKELARALKIQKSLFKREVFIIPVKLADCEIPEEFEQFQYVELYDKDGFAKLVRMLIR